MASWLLPGWLWAGLALGWIGFEPGWLFVGLVELWPGLAFCQVGFGLGQLLAEVALVLVGFGFRACLVLCQVGFCWVAIGPDWLWTWLAIGWAVFFLD